MSDSHLPGCDCIECRLTNVETFVSSHNESLMNLAVALDQAEIRALDAQERVGELESAFELLAKVRVASLEEPEPAYPLEPED